MHGREGKGMAQKVFFAGAAFEWFCLEVKHYNCFNELSNDGDIYLLGQVQKKMYG